MITLNPQNPPSKNFNYHKIKLRLRNIHFFSK
jgi:hypothetical protein